MSLAGRIPKLTQVLLLGLVAGCRTADVTASSSNRTERSAQRVPSSPNVASLGAAGASANAGSGAGSSAGTMVSSLAGAGSFASSRAGAGSFAGSSAGSFAGAASSRAGTRSGAGSGAGSGTGANNASAGAVYGADAGMTNAGNAARLGDGGAGSASHLGNVGIGGVPSAAGAANAPAKSTVDRMIVISVDGLGATYLAARFDLGQLPNFRELQRRGASTLNARSDATYTVTVPNHVTMVTGRPVAADDALPPETHHGWVYNSALDVNSTLHNAGNPKLEYVASVFDVVHDHGKKTCAYLGKQKLSVIVDSYGPTTGSVDSIGEDNGRNKIDRALIDEISTETLVAAAESDFAAGRCDFAFIHISELDDAGHSIGWGTPEWNSWLTRVDAWVGRLASWTTAVPGKPSWGLVLTADHGGSSYNHSDSSMLLHYRIPFFVIGPGFVPDSNLYAMANGARRDPGDLQLRYSDQHQPIRNGDAANTALRLMGLPPVPGSFMRNLLGSE